MNKVAVGCLIAGAVSLLLVAILVGVFAFWMVEKPLLTSTLTVPSEVSMSEKALMVVTSTNNHEEPVTLNSIDIDNQFLAGFQVISVVPGETNNMHVPILDQRSYEFDQVVQPGETVTVTFELRPVQEGRFIGDVDVCNPSQDFQTLLADVLVVETPRE